MHAWSMPSHLINSNKILYLHLYRQSGLDVSQLASYNILIPIEWHRTSFTRDLERIHTIS
jgi:hypothetical protein